MPIFKVRYFDSVSNLLREETASAASMRDARAAFGQIPGRVVLSIRPDGPLGGQRHRFDAGYWCREVITLLRAGMTVVEALESLEASVADSSQRAASADVLARLRRGEALSKAMAGTNAFPDVLVAGVTASERTGALVEVLEDYLRYDELLATLRRKLVSAAIYPAIVVAVGMLVCGFLLVYVIPRFSGMYSGVRGSVSLPTELLIGFSTVLSTYWAPLAVMIAALGVGAVAMARRGNWKPLAAAFVRSVPMLDAQWSHYARAKLYHSLALMIRGGYPLDEALGVCRGLRLDARLDAGISTARAALGQGRNVSSAFAEAGLADILGQRLLAVGERGGEFDRVLQTIAARHSEAFATFIERAARLVEPLLLLAVAVLVAGIVVMMYMPIFDIAGGVR